LWNHLKRAPNISGVKNSKISKRERDAAIEVLKRLEPVERPSAHDRPKLLKKPSKPSRPGAKQAP
jgi:hypothetical protein